LPDAYVGGCGSVVENLPAVGKRLALGSDEARLPAKSRPQALDIEGFAAGVGLALRFRLAQRLSRSRAGEHFALEIAWLSKHAGLGIS
jgi:hypothetical protein